MISYRFLKNFTMTYCETYYTYTRPLTPVQVRARHRRVCRQAAVFERRQVPQLRRRTPVRVLTRLCRCQLRVFYPHALQ